MSSVNTTNNDDDGGPSSCSDGSSSSSNSKNKALETPYNTNVDVPTFCGLLFQVDAYTDLTITSLDLDVRFPEAATSATTDDGSNTNVVNNRRPKVEVYYRLGPYAADASSQSSLGTTWYSNRTGWNLAFRGKADVDNNRTAGVVLPPANFTTISVRANDVLSLYVSMKGPFLDSTANALIKVGEPLLVGNDLRINVGSGLTDPNFPMLINATIDPGFAGVIHYELQQSPSSGTATKPPCIIDDNDNAPSHVPNMTVTQLEFPMVWSTNDTTILGIDQVNRIMESTLQRYLKDPHGSTAQPSSQLQQVGNATTRRDSGWMYTNLCPEGFNTCPPPVASTTTFAFRHDANSYPPAQLLYDLFHAYRSMVQALNAALLLSNGDSPTSTATGSADDTTTNPAQAAYAGPIPAQLRFDMTLTIGGNNKNNKGDASTDDSAADADANADAATGNNADRSLNVGQLNALDDWIGQYLDQAVKSLTAHDFLVHNLTNKYASATVPPTRHVRWLQTASDGVNDTVVVSGTLLGLYESDRVGTPQQYATIVSGAFEKTAGSQFLAFLDSEVAYATGSRTNASVALFQNLQSVTFVSTVVQDNVTSNNGATTDPTVTESNFSSNSLLLIIVGVVAGCVAVAAAILTYCCFCKGSTQQKAKKRLDMPPEERAPDRPVPPSRRSVGLERSGSKLSDSPTNRGSAIRRDESDRTGFDSGLTTTPQRQAPQRSNSSPLGPTSRKDESCDPRLTRSAISNRSIPNPPSPPMPPKNSTPRRDEPPSRGIRRTASSPIARSGAAPRTPPSDRQRSGEGSPGRRARAQSFDGSSRGGEPASGAPPPGREIRRTRSFDDMPTIREGMEAPPRRKTRPPQTYSSSGEVPGVPTQPSPRRPLTKAKSMDCV